MRLLPAPPRLQGIVRCPRGRERDRFSFPAPLLFFFSPLTVSSKVPLPPKKWSCPGEAAVPGPVSRGEKAASVPGREDGTALQSNPTGGREGACPENGCGRTARQKGARELRGHLRNGHGHGTFPTAVDSRDKHQNTPEGGRPPLGPSFKIPHMHQALVLQLFRTLQMHSNGFQILEAGFDPTCKGYATPTQTHSKTLVKPFEETGHVRGPHVCDSRDQGGGRPVRRWPAAAVIQCRQRGSPSSSFHYN